MRLRHGEDCSGVSRGKDHLAVDIGNLDDAATGIGLLQVDVVHPKGVLSVHKVIGGHQRKPKGPEPAPNHEKLVNSAVVDDLDGFSGLISPSARWRILLINNRNMMRTALPRGLVCLRMDLAAVHGPFEHNTTLGNLYHIHVEVNIRQ